MSVAVKFMKCKLQPLQLKTGPNAGDFHFNKETTTGFLSSSSHTSTISAEVSAKVSAAYAGVGAEVGAKLGATDSMCFTTNFSTTVKETNDHKSTPGHCCYLYQAITEVHLTSGEVLTFGGGLVSSENPKELVWENNFDVENVVKGAIRSLENRFLSAPEKTGQECCSAERASAWEEFTFKRLDSTGWAIKTFHGTYLSAQKDGRLTTSNEVSGWETFSVERGASQDIWHIKDFHGKYLSIPANSGQKIRMADSIKGNWEHLMFSFGGRPIHPY